MMESPVSLVPLVHLGKLEYQAHLVNGDPWGQQDIRADKEKKDPRENLEPRDLWVKPDPSDPRDPLAKPVLKDCVVSPGLLGNKDCLVLPVKTALQDPWDLPVSRA